MIYPLSSPVSPDFRACFDRQENHCNLALAASPWGIAAEDRLACPVQQFKPFVGFSA
jgi:hypothetical protein